MEEVVDLARGFGVHAGHMLEVGNRRTLDRLQGAEMAQQRTFSCRPDAGDFLQAGLADVLLAFLAMRTDREAMRFVAQPLHEIQHRITRLELDRLATGNEERLVVVQEVERRHRTLETESLIGTIRQAISETHELQTYEVVLVHAGVLPKTSSGKIQRQACKAAYLEGKFQKNLES